MITISYLPDGVSVKLNPFDDADVISQASAHRQQMEPTASVDFHSIEEAFHHVSGRKEIPMNVLVRGDLRRNVTVGDIMTFEGQDYVVLGYGFHPLRHF